MRIPWKSRENVEKSDKMGAKMNFLEQGKRSQNTLRYLPQSPLESLLSFCRNVSSFFELYKHSSQETLIKHSHIPRNTSYQLLQLQRNTTGSFYFTIWADAMNTSQAHDSSCDSFTWDQSSPLRYAMREAWLKKCLLSAFYVQRLSSYFKKHFVSHAIIIYSWEQSILFVQGHYLLQYFLCNRPLLPSVRKGLFSSELQTS